MSRRSVRTVNAAKQPPFVLAEDAAARAAACNWQRLCPCALLLGFESLPPWLQENEYIRTGYRANWTFSQALRSVFQLHTETFNILSHGGGFIVFAWLLRWLLLNAGSEVQERHHAWSEETHLVVTAGDARLQGPRWPLYIFLIGACTCLLTSAVCHTFACMSQRVHRLIWKLDYAGIVLLISCSFLPPLAFTFLCEPRLMAAYLSAIGIASACTLFLCIAPRFAGPTWRGVRAATFSALGGLGVIPILHQIVHWQVLHRGKDGMPRPLRVAFLLELMMGICYWAGAYIFACRFPEKWFPGKLDLAFNSHNLFHLLVLVGVSTHVEASMILLAWRDRTQCAPVEARP